MQVQERALNVVPDLCETIDYAEVSNVLFPRVAVSCEILIYEYCCTLHRTVGIHQNENIDREGRYAGDVPQYGKDPRSGLFLVPFIDLGRSRSH